MKRVIKILPIISLLLSVINILILFNVHIQLREIIKNLNNSNNKSTIEIKKIPVENGYTIDK